MTFRSTRCERSKYSAFATKKYANWLKKRHVQICFLLIGSEVNMRILLLVQNFSFIYVHICIYIWHLLRLLTELLIGDTSDMKSWGLWSNDLKMLYCTIPLEE